METPATSQLPTHVVLRAFSGPEGRALTRGDKVRAEDWRNVRALEGQRYLRPVGPLDLLEETEGRRKRGQA